MEQGFPPGDGDQSVRDPDGALVRPGLVDRRRNDLGVVARLDYGRLDVGPTQIEPEVSVAYHEAHSLGM
jgi:hypothetical protein